MRLSSNSLRVFYRRVVHTLFALAVCWLFVSSLVVTNYIDLKERSWLCPASPLLQGALFCGLCLFLRRRSPGTRSDFRLFRRLLILAAGILALFWIFLIRTPASIGDAWEVQQAASQLLRGDYQRFQPGAYVAVYPHQSGLILYHCLLQLCAADTTLPFQLSNALGYLAIVYLLGQIGEALGMTQRGVFVTTCIGLLFFPLFFYITFVYGTILGLAFSLGGLLAVIRFCRDGRRYRLFLAPLLFFIAVALKANYQIFVIGAFLYVLFHGPQHNGRRWPLLILLVLSVILAKKLPVLILERWTGCVLDQGYAASSWLAMGLRTDSDMAPGWYDHYPANSFLQAGQNPKVQNAIALDCVSGIVQGYLMDPLSMIRFFVTKNATQWSEPLFQGLWLNQVHLDDAQRSVAPWAAALLSTRGQYFLAQGAGFLQTLLYGGFLLWAWLPSEEPRSPEELLLAVIFLGGFIFHCFWEAKGQYTLPYCVLALPLCVLGYRRLSLPHCKPDRSAMADPRVWTPALLILLSVVLSVILAPALNENLSQFLQRIGC